MSRHHHACTEAASRTLKARKIVALLQSRLRLEGVKILDIGTGSGTIASVLAGMAGSRSSVVSVDVVDVRVESAGYEFHQVGSTVLPFSDGTFDIVVSNHVIEHVGDRADQLSHLSEIRRVLSGDGSCYLATPNRWTVMEPHFKIPFLGWFTPPIQDFLVRRLRGGLAYDCRLLTRSELKRLSALAGLSTINLTPEAVRTAARIEESVLARLFGQLPQRLQRFFGSVLPTMVFWLEPVHLEVRSSRRGHNS